MCGECGHLGGFKSLNSAKTRGPELSPLTHTQTHTQDEEMEGSCEPNFLWQQQGCDILLNREHLNTHTPVLRIFYQSGFP